MTKFGFDVINILITLIILIILIYNHTNNTNNIITIMSNWKRKNNYNGKNKDYSIINKLRKERKSNEEFEMMLSNLSLEDIVALKLELSSRSISNRMYGFPIWNSLASLVKEAVFKSATRTQMEAMRFLGLKEDSFHVLKKKYGVKDFFLDKEESK